MKVKTADKVEFELICTRLKSNVKGKSEKLVTRNK